LTSETQVIVSITTNSRADILLSPQGQLKLGDFGLARVIDPTDGRSLSHQVATRWYRAPELLFASRRYSFSADMWSVGAVVAELMMLKPLFPGSGDIDQIFRVLQVMGTPTPLNWPVRTTPILHPID
jgi:cell cycle related kinase